MGCAALLLLLHPKLAVKWALLSCIWGSVFVVAARMEAVQTMWSESELFLPGAGMVKGIFEFALTVLFGRVPDPDAILAAAHRSLGQAGVVQRQAEL